MIISLNSAPLFLLLNDFRNKDILCRSALFFLFGLYQPQKNPEDENINSYPYQVSVTFRMPPVLRKIKLYVVLF